MAKPPHTVLIITDQHRFDTIVAAGFSHMITPISSAYYKRLRALSRFQGNRA